MRIAFHVLTDDVLSHLTTEEKLSILGENHSDKLSMNNFFEVSALRMQLDLPQRALLCVHAIHAIPHPIHAFISRHEHDPLVHGINLRDVVLGDVY